MRRLECLDGLRGLLAAYVMLGHMAPFAVLPAWLQSLLSHGGAAVEMFFILSGLVIARSLESAGYQAAPFLIARAARIFPAFLAVFAVAVAIQPLPIGFEHMPWISLDSPAHAISSSFWPHDWAARILAHLTMTHGVFPNAILPDVWVDFLGAAWSLSTEWQFYLAALLIGRLRYRAWTTTRFLLVFAFAGAAWDSLAPEPWRFSRAFLGNEAAWFALGIASSAVVRANAGGPPATYNRTIHARYLAVLAAASMLAFWAGPPGKLLVPFCWTLCLAAQLDWPRWRLGVLAQVLSSNVLQWLGGISYSLYLVNEPVQKIIGLPFARLADGNALLFTAIWIPAATLLPIAAAALLRRHVELPVLRIGRRLALGA